MTRALLRTRTLVFGLAASSLLAACDGSQPFEPDMASNTATSEMKTAQSAAPAPIAKLDEHLSAADIAKIKAELERIAQAARTCANGGYATVTTSNGRPFRNSIECLLYATLGGTLVPKVVVVVPPPVITDFQAVGPENCGTPELVWTYIATFTGGTGVVDNGVGPITSGTVFVGPYDGSTLTLTVTNSQGVSVSHGIFYNGNPGIGCPGGGGIGGAPL